MSGHVTYNRMNEGMYERECKSGWRPRERYVSMNIYIHTPAGRTKSFCEIICLALKKTPSGLNQALQSDSLDPLLMPKLTSRFLPPPSQNCEYLSFHSSKIPHIISNNDILLCGAILKEKHYKRF